MEDVLASYRQMVANDKTGSALAMIVAEMEQQSIRIDGPQYKRVPSGFDPDHPRSDLLRRKGLSAWHDAPLPEAIHGPDAVRLCVEQYRTMLPVYDWLSEVAYSAFWVTGSRQRSRQTLLTRIKPIRLFSLCQQVCFCW